jgi:hypothetical protein
LNAREADPASPARTIWRVLVATITLLSLQAPEIGL